MMMLMKVMKVMRVRMKVMTDEGDGDIFSVQASLLQPLQEGCAPPGIVTTEILINNILC